MLLYRKSLLQKQCGNHFQWKLDHRCWPYQKAKQINFNLHLHDAVLCPQRKGFTPENELQKNRLTTHQCSGITIIIDIIRH